MREMRVSLVLAVAFAALIVLSTTPSAPLATAPPSLLDGVGWGAAARFASDPYNFIVWGGLHLQSFDPTTGSVTYPSCSSYGFTNAKPLSVAFGKTGFVKTNFNDPSAYGVFGRSSGNLAGTDQTGCKTWDQDGQGRCGAALSNSLKHFSIYPGTYYYAYLFGGYKDNYYCNAPASITDEILQWDGSSFTVVGHLPKKLAHVSAVLNETTGDIYIFGGWDGTIASDSIYLFHPGNGQVELLVAVLPTPAFGMGAVLAGPNQIGNGEVWLFGGAVKYSGGLSSYSVDCVIDPCLNTALVFDMTLGKVSVSGATLPTPRVGIAAANAYGGQPWPTPDCVWLFGGRDRTTDQLHDIILAGCNGVISL